MKRLLPLLLGLLASCEAARPPDDPRIKVIAVGTAYRKSDYLVPGKVSILTFTADW